MLQRKAKIACPPYELDACQVLGAVSPVVSHRTRRLRKESDPFIVDHPIGLNADGFCQCTDGVLRPLIRLRANRLNRRCLVTWSLYARIFRPF